MGAKFIDLTGKRFGQLTVIKKIGSDKRKNVVWLCICDCGKETIRTTTRLKTGYTKSCGCLCVQKLLERNTKHNMTHTRLYKIYKGLIQRCYSPSNPAYENYGNRGIKISEEWLDKEKGFINFYNWAMQNGYKDNLSIDRINNNGNYEPDNCRWATEKEQSNNRRTNHYITYNGETHTLKEWSEILNVSYSMLSHRFQRKWDIEKALFFPSRKELYNGNNN